MEGGGMVDLPKLSKASRKWLGNDGRWNSKCNEGQKSLAAMCMWKAWAKTQQMMMMNTKHKLIVFYKVIKPKNVKSNGGFPPRL